MIIHFISYFFSIIETVLVRFVGIECVTFVHTLSVAFIILSLVITEVSAITFKYLPFS